MDKRYQVFVSSTFRDLQDERQEVMQALLELDCIPAGMELFPAANEDQWTLIKKVIDDCDYYLVIIAGRYGSIGPDGISYTEMEYRYALEHGKPVLGFLHKDPGSLPAARCETAADAVAKLKDFRTFVQMRMCRFWDSPADLGSQVSRSLVKLIKTTPAIGWVKANLVPDASSAEEILRLRKTIEVLQSQLAAARLSAPEGTSTLAQGDDELTIHFAFYAAPRKESYRRTGYRSNMTSTWNAVFARLSPLMIDDAAEAELRAELARLVETEEGKRLEAHEQFDDHTLSHFEVDGADFQTIKVQLRALGLITKSTKNRGVKDTSTYWTLTPYGDAIMTRLRAMPRGQTKPHGSTSASAKQNVEE